MNRNSDVIEFDPTKEQVEEEPEETKEAQTKAQVSDKTKEGGKTDKEKKVPRYMKPKVAVNIPNNREN